jgi:hypothetical protein
MNKKAQHREAPGKKRALRTLMEVGLARISGGLFHAVGATQHGPVDIRAQVFAPYQPASSALDGWAAFSRHLAQAFRPLINHCRGHIHGAGQDDLAAQYFCRPDDMFVVHAASVAKLFQNVQAMLYLFFNSIALRNE